MSTRRRLPGQLSRLSLRARLLLFVAVMPVWMGLGSCDYIQRFFLIIRENRNPCVGVMTFTFELEDPQGIELPVVKERPTEDALPESLYWSIGTGSCQHLTDGIALKEIPFGGERRLTIKGTDSSGRLISLGTSPSFILEPSGDNVVDRVNMDLVRGCRKFDATGSCISPETIGFGTLVVRFPTGAIPFNTKLIVFRLAPDPKQVPPNFEIRIQVAAPPGFLILANLPSTTSRAYTIEAFDNAQQKLATLVGSYGVPSQATATTGTSRVQPQPKTTP